MNHDNERKAFIDKLRELDYFSHATKRWDGINDRFEHDGVQTHWEMWLASANREGCKLVPLEPTERMLDSAYSSISDNLHYADLENIYTAMIGACDDH